ncbi:hypothetical protein A4X09_0g6108 [Tilletia walkeri]|uniref:Uncharacterized protein n=1 Tax=Tilletia walkeri TaxID=117179 RepID=A0A8X7N4I1_9BASI|nr:hypothetical protein A4X09_0g6108 [Tilletia walkeri]
MTPSPPPRRRKIRVVSSATPRSAMPIPLTGPPQPTSTTTSSSNQKTYKKSTSTASARSAPSQLANFKLTNPVVDSLIREHPSSVAGFALRAFHIGQDNQPPHRAYWATGTFGVLMPGGLEARVSLWRGRTRVGGKGPPQPGAVPLPPISPPNAKITQSAIQIALAYALLRDKRKKRSGSDARAWGLTARLREVGIARLLDLMRWSRKAVVEIVRRDIWDEQSGWTTLLKFALSHQSASFYLGSSTVSGAGGLNTWTTLSLDSAAPRPRSTSPTATRKSARRNSKQDDVDEEREERETYEISDSNEEGTVRAKKAAGSKKAASSSSSRGRSKSASASVGEDLLDLKLNPPDEIMLGLKTDLQGREIEEVLRPYLHTTLLGEYERAEKAFDAELQRAQDEELDVEFYIHEAVKMEDELYPVPPALRLNRMMPSVEEKGGKTKGKKNDGEREIVVLSDDSEEEEGEEGTVRAGALTAQDAKARAAADRDRERERRRLRRGATTAGQSSDEDCVDAASVRGKQRSRSAASSSSHRRQIRVEDDDYDAPAAGGSDKGGGRKGSAALGAVQSFSFYSTGGASVSSFTNSTSMAYLSGIRQVAAAMKGLDGQPSVISLSSDEEDDLEVGAVGGGGGAGVVGPGVQRRVVSRNRRRLVDDDEDENEEEQGGVGGAENKENCRPAASNASSSPSVIIIDNLGSTVTTTTTTTSRKRKWDSSSPQAVSPLFNKNGHNHNGDGDANGSRAADTTATREEAQSPSNGRSRRTNAGVPSASVRADYVTFGSGGGGGNHHAQQENGRQGRVSMPSIGTGTGMAAAAADADDDVGTTSPYFPRNAKGKGKEEPIPFTDDTIPFERPNGGGGGGRQSLPAQLPPRRRYEGVVLEEKEGPNDEERAEREVDELQFEFQLAERRRGMKRAAIRYGHGHGVQGRR